MRRRHQGVLAMKVVALRGGGIPRCHEGGLNSFVTDSKKYW